MFPIISRPLVFMLCLAASSAVLPAGRAAAQQTSFETDAANYVLSFDRIKQVLAVLDGLNGLARTNPAEFAKINRDLEAASSGGVSDAEKQAAVLDRHASTRAVLSRAGISSRDYALASMAFGEAVFRAELGAGATPAKTPAEKANVALLQQNPAEWTVLKREYERIAAEASADD